MAPEKPVAVDLFLVRHGESKWNEATKSPLKLPQLVGWDHLLTKVRCVCVRVCVRVCVCSCVSNGLRFLFIKAGSALPIIAHISARRC